VTAERPWRLIVSGAGAAAFNQALDLALMESLDERPVLRLYGWSPPALSIGHFQPAEAFEPLARAHGLPVVRRPTGGGAIHHDQELTFCLLATPGRDGYPAGVVPAYERVHAILSEGLSRLGPAPLPRGGDAPLSVRPRSASLCFADTTALDLVDESGRKLLGSAQRRRGGRVLHHGSIPLRVPALTPGSSALDELARRPVSWEEAAGIVRDAFANSAWGGGLEPDSAHPDELERARQLAPGRVVPIPTARSEG